MTPENSERKIEQISKIHTKCKFPFQGYGTLSVILHALWMVFHITITAPLKLFEITI